RGERRPEHLVPALIPAPAPAKAGESRDLVVRHLWPDDEIPALPGFRRGRRRDDGNGPRTLFTTRLWRRFRHPGSFRAQPDVLPEEFMAQITATDWIWRDGEFIPWNDAQVHLLAHSLQFGSSIFEGIRCYSTPRGPAIFRLEDHLVRM